MPKKSLDTICEEALAALDKLLKQEVPDKEKNKKKYEKFIEQVEKAIQAVEVNLSNFEKELKSLKLQADSPLGSVDVADVLKVKSMEQRFKVFTNQKVTLFSKLRTDKVSHKGKDFITDEYVDLSEIQKMLGIEIAAHRKKDD